MKILCIAGLSEPDLHQFDHILQQGGMAAPRPSERVPDLNVDAWHRRVLGFEQNGSVPETRSAPGKFLEQLVSDIFVANMGANLWGWSDSRSTWLLDFWADYEPRLLFVLVCTSPAYQLARFMESNTPEPPDVAQVAAAWQAYHQELLQFHHRCPQRSVLVSAGEGFSNASSLVRYIAKKWDLPLAADAVQEGAAVLQPSSLACHLAESFLEDRKETAALWNEIEATLAHVVPAANRKAEPSTDVMMSFRTLRDRSAEQKRIQALTAERYSLKKSVEDKSNKLQSLEEKHRQLEQTNQVLTAERDRASEANDSLVGQLRQMQKEMHSHLQLKREVDQELGAAQASLAGVTKDRDEQTTLAQQREKQINVFALERDSLKKSVNEKSNKLRSLEEKHRQLEQTNELLVRQLQQMQEEMESHLQLKREVDQKLSAVQASLAAMTKARDEQATLARQRQEQIDALSAERDALKEKAAEDDKKSQELQAKHREVNEENELLVLQLHRAQEELESIFVQIDTLKADLDKADVRWKRLLTRYPDYHDYDSLNVIPGGEKSTLLWDITDLEINGRRFPRMQLETFAMEGVAGFRFSRAGKDAQKHEMSLLRWPDVLWDKQVASVIPVAQTSEDVKRCTAILDSLAASDWHMLPFLGRFLQACLRDDQLTGHLAKASRTETVVAVDRLLRLITNYPPALRYDRIRLQQEHQEPGYEHLWLNLENLQYGDIRCPSFEFRLACANVGSAAFGSDPRIEFPPTTAGSPLGSWFEESRGPFGPKLELRFALPEAMDLDVWRELAPEDAAFVQALVQHFPVFLTHLRRAGVSISRTWEDWDRLGDNIKNIMALRIAMLTRGQEK